MNRLKKSWNMQGHEVVYWYNGLGQRTGRIVNGREEDYLLDLTRSYHNLLEISREGNEQRFYIDWNIATMEEKRKEANESGRTAFSGLHYYMQDGLGSPLRVSGFGIRAGALASMSNYLAYGYDEFGNDFGKELEETGASNPYDVQGEEQPFGYTGYRYDEVSKTYFAQAREYQTERGRFVEEDLVGGNIADSVSLNRYGYCRNNPEKYIDLDGRIAFLAAIAIGAAVGAVIDLGIQAYDNYSNGEDVLDASNYNFLETAIMAGSSALMVSVPYAAPSIAGYFGISTRAASMIGYGVIGGITGGLVEKVTDAEASLTDVLGEAVKGVVGSVVVAGFGHLISQIPVVQRIGSSMGHSIHSFTPIGGGKIVSDVPKGWYLRMIDLDTTKLFAIDQVSGAFFTLTWEGFLRGVDKIFGNDESQEDNKE